MVQSADMMSYSCGYEVNSLLRAAEAAGRRRGSPKLALLPSSLPIIPRSVFLQPEPCENPAQGMLWKIPLSLLTLERACSKLFQLTNLRRLQISPDPETSLRHLVGSLQADLKGKLISFFFSKPG